MSNDVSAYTFIAKGASCYMRRIRQNLTNLVKQCQQKLRSTIDTDIFDLYLRSLFTFGQTIEKAL